MHDQMEKLRKDAEQRGNVYLVLPEAKMWLLEQELTRERERDC